MNLEQRSPEWHAWRRKGIGSSEAAVLMGLTQYKTLDELWEEKLGLRVAPNITNPDMQRGIDNEDLVLATFINQTGVWYEPLTIQHPDFEFLKSSLDGANTELKRFVEIKCPRPHIHEKTKLYGFIKPDYFCQMQHQYLTTDFEHCDFLSFDVVTEDLVIIPVPPDLDYMAELMSREILFWEHVTNKTRPNTRDFGVYDRAVGSKSSVEF